MNAIDDKLEAAERAIASRAWRNPRTVAEIEQWIDEWAWPIKDRLTSADAALRRRYGATAGVKFFARLRRDWRAHEEWTALRPWQPWLEIEVRGAGEPARTFLEISDNAIWSRRTNDLFDADDPRGRDSLAFLDMLEDEIIALAVGGSRPLHRDIREIQ